MKRSRDEAWADRFLAAVRTVDRPGSFAMSGTVPAILPGLDVSGIGQIGLPLTAKQAAELSRRCEQAPYGKGEKTLVDTNVRRVRRLKPDQFTLTNPEWAVALAEVVTKVQVELGLTQKLEAHLYDLLLYEEGGFFLPHRDGEKQSRMVATLVISLPSSHTGGELIVRHEGQERVVDFSGKQDNFRIQYAAFYADCEHEVRPLSSGWRLCLVYNLTLAKSGRTTGAPRRREAVDAVTQLLAEWDKANHDPQKVAVALEHQYTKGGLAWDQLKGVDRARADLLAEAAAAAGCHAYLALLTFWQSGSVDDDYGHRSQRRGYNPEDDTEFDEVYDSSRTADDWRAPDGTSRPFGPLPLEEDQILPEDALTSVSPEKNVEGYTGNEGLTLDLWYRRAAIVLWPESRQFQVLCSAGAKQAVGALLKMVSGAEKEAGLDGDSIRQRIHAFTTEVLARWPKEDLDRWRPSGNSGTDPLGAVEFTDDPALLRLYLRNVVKLDRTIEPGQALVRMIERHGWSTFEADLKGVFQTEDGRLLRRNAAFLDVLCKAAGVASKKRSDDAKPVCRRLAEVAVDTLIYTDGRRKIPDEWRFRRDSSETPAMLELLASAMMSVDADSALDRLLAHIRTAPDEYVLQTVQLPALIAAAERGRSPALESWLRDCMSQLEALTAVQPEPPSDMRREPKINCKCRDCAVVNEFLANPVQERFAFQAAEPRRKHVASAIDYSKCDLTFKTDRKPRPQVLICTKTQSTYERLLKEYHSNLKHLAALRRLESKPRPR